MTTYDLAVVGGTLVDGSGLPRRRADVMVKDGKVAAIGFAEEGDRGADGRRHRAGRRPGDRRPPHPLRPTADLRALRHLLLLPRGHDRPGRQLRVLGGPDQEGRPAVHHPDVRPGRGHVGRRSGRPPVGLRDLPRVPGRPAGPHRGEPGLLRGPLGRPPVGHGRRRASNGWPPTTRSARWPGSCPRRWRPAPRASRRPTPRPTGTAPTVRCPPVSRPWRSSRPWSPPPGGPTPAPSPTCRRGPSGACSPTTSSCSSSCRWPPACR